MGRLIADEEGSERFSDPDGALAGLSLTFGPVAGGQPRWSLLRLGVNGVAERLVLEAPRPSRNVLCGWLSGAVDEVRAAALLRLVGRLTDFYVGYYAARPDLAGWRHAAVA